MMPEPEEIEAEIARAIRKVKKSMETIPLTADVPFASLGLESLERAIVVFEIEDAYEIDLVATGLDNFRTIGEARDIIAGVLAKKESAEGAA
jgi:acyl carrier protein